MSDNFEEREEQSSDLDGRYLLFRIADSLYGVVLALVLEIIQIQSITKLPCVAPYVKGIINLRGKVVPVVDVRQKMKLPEKPHDAETCIIVLEIQNMHIGLIVDSVCEVIRVESDSLATPPNTGDAAGCYLSSISEIGGKAVLNIDFERFFQDDIDIVKV